MNALRLHIQCHRVEENGANLKISPKIFFSSNLRHGQDENVCPSAYLLQKIVNRFWVDFRKSRGAPEVLAKGKYAKLPMSPAPYPSTPEAIAEAKHAKKSANLDNNGSPFDKDDFPPVLGVGAAKKPKQLSFGKSPIKKSDVVRAFAVKAATGDATQPVISMVDALNQVQMSLSQFARNPPENQQAAENVMNAVGEPVPNPNTALLWRLPRNKVIPPRNETVSRNSPRCFFCSHQQLSPTLSHSSPRPTLR
jgi:hypothetical protein